MEPGLVAWKEPWPAGYRRLVRGLSNCPISRDSQFHSASLCRIAMSFIFVVWIERISFRPMFLLARVYPNIIDAAHMHSALLLKRSFLQNDPFPPEILRSFFYCKPYFLFNRIIIPRMFFFNNYYHTLVYEKLLD